MRLETPRGVLIRSKLSLNLNFRRKYERHEQYLAFFVAWGRFDGFPNNVFDDKKDMDYIYINYSTIKKYSKTSEHG